MSQQVSRSHQIPALSQDIFDQTVRASVPTLVDFTAPWCAPCRALAPTVAAIAADYAGRLQVATCNIDENQSIAQAFEIRSVPTLLVFKGGHVVGQLVGAVPRARIEALLAAAL